MFEMIGAIVGAIMGLIGTGVSIASQNKTNEENREYATSMTTAQWERDDSSLQRQVADAKAVGLSPLAVTGSLNSSSPLNYVAQAPQMDLSSLIGLVGSSTQAMSTNKEKEKQREHESENLDKQLTYNLHALEKQIHANKELQESQEANDILLLGKQLSYQYDVLNEQSKAHAQDLESDRLTNLSNQSMETYKQISESIGMAPRTEYVNNLKDYTDMYNSFMRKYNNFLEDWKGVDMGSTTQESNSESMGSDALQVGVKFTTSSGKTYDSKSALLHDMFAEYFTDAVLPIYIDSEKWSSRDYKQQD